MFTCFSLNKLTENVGSKPFSKIDKPITFADYGKGQQAVDSKNLVDIHSSPKGFDFKSTFAYAINTTSLTKQGIIDMIDLILFA